MGIKHRHIIELDCLESIEARAKYLLHSRDQFTNLSCDFSLLDVYGLTGYVWFANLNKTKVLGGIR